jgi:hypothetical protein
MAIAAVAAAVVTGCSSSQTPAQLASADCNTLQTNLTTAGVDLELTQGGNNLVPASGNVLSLGNASQAEANVASDIGEAWTECEQTKKALSQNTPNVASADEAAESTVIFTDTATQQVEAVVRHPENFADLGRADQSQLKDSLEPLLSAESDAQRLQRDLPKSKNSADERLQAKLRDASPSSLASVTASTVRRTRVRVAF